MKLTGRILHLAEDPDLVRRQLDGEDLDGVDAYRFGVNTDAMISGRACTLGWTEDILGPWFLQDFGEVVGHDAIRAGGFQVVVGGDAYGSGSSREVAVVAHRGAGIALVVADSVQRIFQENMVYSGMPFTTDRTVLDRLQAGEAIDPADLARPLPPLFRAIAEAGGLLAYAHGLVDGTRVAPAPPAHGPRPMTLVERLLSQRAVVPGADAPSLAPGDQILAHTGFRGVHEYTAAMVVDLYEQAFGDTPMHDPDGIAAFEDHFVLLDHTAVPEAVRDARLGPARAMRDAMVAACARYGIGIHGPGRDRPPGVCHRLVVERYARPGDVVVLTDSHTPTAGVLGAFAFGVGSTAMAFALRTGMIPVTVPRTVRVELTGRPEGGLSPKDVILHLIGDPWMREERWREGPADTCVLEFAGPGLDHWSVDELSVLTNMTVEGGLMTGVVAPCAPVAAYLEATGRGGLALPDADPGAAYARVIRLDLGEVPLTVASPGDSRNRAPLADHGDVPIHNVVIASCTGGSLADLRAAAQVLHGRHLAPGVRLTVSPSSQAVLDAATAEGLIATFEALGAVVTVPGCGSCIGNGPGIPHPGETTASTTNRNFDRRMGAPGPVWLVSPAVAAASAITGRLTDPRTLPEVSA